MSTSASPHRNASRQHRATARRRTGLMVMTAVLFLYFVAAAAPSPLLPDLLERWHFAPWLLTFAFAIYALTILVALLVVGRLSDYVGRRPVILVATSLELVAMVVFLMSQEIATFVVARTIQGLGTGAATGALSAAIADYSGERRANLTSTLSSVGPLSGLACGAVFAGAAAEVSDEAQSIVFVSLIALFTLAVVVVWLAPEPSSTRVGAVSSLFPRVAVPPAARVAFWRAVPVAGSVWMTGGFYLSVVGESTRDIFGIQDQLMDSLLIAGLSATGAVTVTLTQGLHPRSRATAGTLLIAFGMLSTLLAATTAATALLILGTVVSGAGFGMAFSGAVGLVIPHARAHERGELFSAIYVVNYLAFGVPAIAAGFLISPLGLDIAVVSYAALIVAVSALAVFVQATASRIRRR